MSHATQKVESSTKYDFGGRLTAEFPSRVIIDVTESW